MTGSKKVFRGMSTPPRTCENTGPGTVLTGQGKSLTGAGIYYPRRYTNVNLPWTISSLIGVTFMGEANEMRIAPMKVLVSLRVSLPKKAGINKAMMEIRKLYKKQSYMMYTAIPPSVYGKMSVKNHPPEEKLKAFIADIAKMLSDHLHFSRIMMCEVVSGGTNFGETQDVSGTFRVIKGIIDEGVQNGVFVKTDPIVII